MANKFNIVIGITDRATVGIKKFNKAIDNIFKPVRALHTGFQKIGKELSKNMIVKGLSSITKGATAVLSKITGVAGALAGVTFAAGVAAVANMAREWAVAGGALKRFSAVTGIGTSRIQSLSGAAQAFGLEAGDMQAGLKSLGETMEDALYGRNQEALMLMNRLGIRLKRTKDGAIDTAAGLMDIANAITHIKNVQAQGLVARTFGMENLLPLLQKGPAGIAELERLVRASHAIATPEQIDAAAKLQQKVSLLGLSFTGLKNAIFGDAAPALDTFVDKVTAVTNALTDAINKKKLFTMGGVTERAPATENWLANFLDPLYLVHSGKAKRGLFFGGDQPPSGGGGRGGPVGGNGPAPQKGTMGEAAAQAALRKLFPGLNITSGFRTPEKNASLPGSAKNSYHLLGQAADFIRPSGMNLAAIRRALQAAHMPITELLDEGDHIHYAWGDPRRKANRQSVLAAQIAAARKGTPELRGTASEPAHVVVEFKNAPAGMQAKQKKANADVRTTLKVSYSLPEVSMP